MFDPIDLNSPSLEEMKAAVQAADEYGGYVAVHSYTDTAYNKSMDAGVKCFEHGFLIGEETAATAEAAARLFPSLPVERTTDVDTLLTRLRREVRDGDVVLVKGSRANALERVVDGLTAEGTR